MKKIAFVTRSLGVGGTEKALTELIDSIPESEAEIVVYMSEKNIPMAEEITRRVELRYYTLPTLNWKRDIFTLLKRFQPLRALRYALCFFTRNKGKHCEAICLRKCRALMTEKVKEKFDAAIAFYLPCNEEVFVVDECFSARKKFAWLHLDVSMFQREMREMKGVYGKMDAVYCVSADSRKKFLSLFPQWESKTKIFHNVIDKEKILLRSKEYSVEKTSEITLFTCARVSEEKQPFLAADALKKLIESGADAKWIWVGGDNKTVDKLKEYLKENALEERFLLLGTLKNPYPYHRACDAYVQTSKHESYCLSLAEAKILCGRIVSTCFPTAYEILEDFPVKEIVEMNGESVCEGIKKVLAQAPQRYDARPDYKDEVIEFLKEI